MSAIGSALGSIGSAIGSVFGGGGGGILSDIVPVVAGFFTGGPVGAGLGLLSDFAKSAGSKGSIANDITSGIGSLIGGGNSGLGGFLDSIGTGISDIFSGGFSSFLSGANSILGDIKSGIDQVSKIEADVINPIAGVVHSLTADVQAINDQVIAPIRGLIENYNTTATATLQAISKDLHNGLTGFLQLPQDLSNAFTSVDAQFSRATQELGQQNADIVTEKLVPGLSAGIGDPLKAISEQLSGPEYTAVSGAAFLESLNLSEETAADPGFAIVQEIVRKLEDATGPWSAILHGMLDGFRIFDYIIEMSRISLQPVYQQVLADQPNTLLGIGEATEAVRRGLIDPKAWSAELAKHGINQDRQDILYALAQFLFGPREAVELYQRGIINQDTFNALMDQNNLDPGQASSLIELMQKELGPADIAAAVARGYVSPADAEPMYQAALVPESLRPIIPELEKDLVNPAKMTAMYGRQVAAEAGFLQTSLLSPPPEQIKQQYDRTQAEDGSAELDWLSHWDVPGAAWWVDAYFRGLVTLTEVQNAFTALRIPEELWGNIIAVEEELPPVWLVPDIVKTGVWSAEQAIPVLMKLGFSRENAQVLYDYGYAARKVTATTTADDLAKVSLGNAKAAFDDGIIDAATYKQVLLDHKYSEAAADLTVSLAEYSLAQTELKSQADLLVEEVKLGVISKDQAESNLYNLGMSTAQVAKYLDKIEASKVMNAKLPSEAQVEAMYKKGIIDQGVAAETLSLLGYSDLWAARIMALW